MLTDSEYSCVSSEQQNPESIADTNWIDISSNLSIWSVIEPCISIIAACLPTLGPLVRDGVSLQSLIRSLQPRCVKRSRAISTESDRSIGPVHRTLSSSERAWHKFQEDYSNTSYSVEVELGKPAKPQEACFLKAIRIVDSMDDDSEEPSSIRVDRSFGTESEQRRS